MTLQRRGLAFTIMAVLTVPSAVRAQDAQSYIERYVGEWDGGGSVQVQQLPKPVNVSCDAAGTSDSETEFALAGNCSAFLVLSNEIGAELTLDAESGEYTGVYTGSKSGPATLAGTREGDALNLVVTWGKVIYDDDTAEMTITNTGDGTFTMVVTEKIDGEDVVVSDLTFERQSPDATAAQ